MMLGRTFASVVVAGCLAAAVAAQGRAPVASIASLDLERYAGTWFEIARFPNRFQRRCAGDVRATYARRPDGRIDVLNECRTDDGGTIAALGLARVPDARRPAQLEVRFAPAYLSWLPFVWADYWVIALDGQYRWAVVGTPDRDYLWILSRTPALDPRDYEAATARAAAQGFDPSRLERGTPPPP